MCSCSNEPPIKTETITDISYYGKYNTYVNNDLEQTIALLPPQIPSDATVDKFKYSYTCAALGDPNYSIILSLCFIDKESYCSEKNRIMELVDSSTSTITNTFGEQWLFWGETENGLKQLTNDEVLDGLYVRVTYAVCNDDNNQIVYAVGLLVDGSSHDNEIIEIGCSGF